MVSDGALNEVALDFGWEKMYDLDESGTFYIMPSCLFCLRGNEMLLSERFGPELKRRLLGKLVHRNDSLKVEWTTLWRSTDEKAKGPGLNGT